MDSDGKISLSKTLQRIAKKILQQSMLNIEVYFERKAKGSKFKNTET